MELLHKTMLKSGFIIYIYFGQNYFQLIYIISKLLHAFKPLIKLVNLTPLLSKSLLTDLTSVKWFLSGACTHNKHIKVQG